MRHIGLDFDDTLIPTRDAILAFFNRRFGTAYKSQDFPTFRFSSVWGLTDEKFAELFHANLDYFHSMAPLPGMLETIAQWRNDSKFYIITGRPDCWVPPAATWLKRHDIPYEEIINTSESMSDKGRLAQERGITLFIEDHAEAAMSLANVGIDVLLIDMPYNQQCVHPRIQRVFNWDEIRSAAHSYGTQ